MDLLAVVCSFIMKKNDVGTDEFKVMAKGLFYCVELLDTMIEKEPEDNDFKKCRDILIKKEAILFDNPNPEENHQLAKRINNFIAEMDV